MVTVDSTVSVDTLAIEENPKFPFLFRKTREKNRQELQELREEVIGKRRKFEEGMVNLEKRNSELIEVFVNADLDKDVKPYLGNLQERVHAASRRYYGLFFKLKDTQVFREERNTKTTLLSKNITYSSLILEMHYVEVDISERLVEIHECTAKAKQELVVETCDEQVKDIVSSLEMLNQKFDQLSPDFMGDLMDDAQETLNDIENHVFFLKALLTRFRDPNVEVDEILEKIHEFNKSLNDAQSQVQSVHKHLIKIEQVNIDRTRRLAKAKAIIERKDLPDILSTDRSVNVLYDDFVDCMDDMDIVDTSTVTHVDWLNGFVEESMKPILDFLAEVASYDYDMGKIAENKEDYAERVLFARKQFQGILNHIDQYVQVSPMLQDRLEEADAILSGLIQNAKEYETITDRNYPNVNNIQIFMKDNFALLLSLSIELIDLIDEKSKIAIGI